MRAGGGGGFQGYYCAALGSLPAIRRSSPSSHRCRPTIASTKPLLLPPLTAWLETRDSHSAAHGASGRSHIKNGRMPRLLPRQAPAPSARPARASRRAAPRHRRRRCPPALAPQSSPRARAAAAAQRLHKRLSVASSAAARCDRLCGGGKPRAGDRACQRGREREDDVALANAHPAARHGRLRRQDSGACSLARCGCYGRGCTICSVQPALFHFDWVVCLLRWLT